MTTDVYPDSNSLGNLNKNESTRLQLGLPLGRPMSTLYEMSSLKHSADLLVKVNKIQNAAYKPVPSFDQLFIYLLLFTLLL